MSIKQVHFDFLIKSSFLVVTLFLYPSVSVSDGLNISCGASKGYSYFFEGGLVGKDKEGFIDDGISNGKISLTVDEDGNPDVLTLDSTGSLKSATSQGGKVFMPTTSDNGANWVIQYGDGTLEVYSYSITSKKVAIYRNTIGSLFPKNSLFISDCSH